MALTPSPLIPHLTHLLHIYGYTRSPQALPVLLGPPEATPDPLSDDVPLQLSHSRNDRENSPTQR